MRRRPFRLARLFGASFGRKGIEWLCRWAAVNVRSYSKRKSARGLLVSSTLTPTLSITAFGSSARITTDSSSDQGRGRDGRCHANRSVRCIYHGLGTTPHDGLFLANIAPASAGAQQMSSRIRWLGKGWKTNATAAASQSVEWTVDLLPVQGSSAPTGNLILGIAHQ